MSSKKTKCNVRDGLFVEPCETLEKATDYVGPRGGRGFRVYPITNMNTRQPARTFYGVKTEEFPKCLAINFCPFCGVQIDAPFHREDEFSAKGEREGGTDA